MHVVIAPDVLFRHFGGEGVLLHLGSERYFSLNDSALRVWELLTAGDSVEAVVEKVAAEFDAPSEVVAEDVAQLLEQLQEAGLVLEAARP